MCGLGKVDNRICVVLEWTLGLKRLAYSRIDLLCCISLYLKGAWETQNHQKFCMRLVLVSFTLIYRAACPLLLKHSFLSHMRRASETSSHQLYTGYLRTKGQESVYETRACVIHTNLLSYMCIYGKRILLISIRLSSYKGRRQLRKQGFLTS